MMKITEGEGAQNETGKTIETAHKLFRYKLALKDLDNPSAQTCKHAKHQYHIK